MHDWEGALKEISELKPRLSAQVRALGTDPEQASSTAATALDIVIESLQDANARWVLSPHARAASEVSWAGLVDGGLHTVRVDRVFQAGPEPGSEGADVWWIVDYKTAIGQTLDPEKALPELRALFAGQLEAYAHVLRGLHGADAVIRAGLCYPRMKMFDWWEI